MRSLWLKLLAAFALVIFLGAAVNGVLVSSATSGQFNRFVTASGQGWTAQMAPALADFYARTGSWTGVEPLLRSPWLAVTGTVQAEPAHQELDADEAGRRGVRGSGMMGAGMMGAGMMNPGVMGEHMMGADMWRSMGLRLLLADSQGKVLADTGAGTGMNAEPNTGPGLTGTYLTAAEMAAGTPIQVGGAAAGVLLPVAAAAESASPAAEFLAAAGRATWLSSLAAAAVALLLGVFLFREIVAPVRAVTQAAQEIAAGKLDQRVPVRTHDEIGQMAQTFNQMADALARDQRQRQNMMADIAHELRTPLSIIQANLEAMQDGVLPPEPAEIALLQDETLLLTRLVTDLHLLSLAEAGQLKLERTSTDLNDLVGRSVEQFRVQADLNQVELQVELAADPLPVDLDTDRIGQVLNNLLANALRYTPAGGRITVRSRLQPAPGSAATAVVEVADTGKGIDAADLPYVFDRFYRADKSRSRASGGSGIGLALVKQLAEAHGGRVWVESTPGAGSTFFLALPLPLAARS